MQALDGKVTVMRVFVAGGTGAIGRRLVPHLVAHGDQVTARRRGRTSWGVLAQLGADGAASATVLAVEQKATGVFNIADDEPAPASEWLPYLAACAGAKRPMRVPRDGRAARRDGGVR